MFPPTTLREKKSYRLSKLEVQNSFILYVPVSMLIMLHIITQAYSLFSWNFDCSILQSYTDHQENKLPKIHSAIIMSAKCVVTLGD